MKPFALASVLTLAASLVACDAMESARQREADPAQARLTALDPPAGAGAMAPRVGVGGEGVLLSWLEPDGDGHRLMVSRLDPATGAWSSPVAAMEGGGVFANWADLPQVAEGGDGTLVAHRLEKLGEGTYAYGVALAVSRDGGAGWERAGLLHDDASENEHGFAAWVPTADGLQAFWLDGRAMGGGGEHEGHGGHGGGGGPMQLRATTVAGGEPAPSVELDDRTCECCAADAALATDGPVVVYRDRDEDEVRDVALVRWTGEGWSAPAAVHADGWVIPGCPVNGPAVAADGDRVVVAWYTAAGGRARVHAAFSADGGASFDIPLTIDEAKPLGRVDVVAAPGGEAWVSWLAGAGERAELRLARVAPGGVRAVEKVVATTASRAAGVPQLAAAGDRLLAVWVDTAEQGTVRAALVEPPGG